MSDGKDFTPDPEEAERIAHHFGPDGPVAAVYAWLDLVRTGDFGGAWVSWMTTCDCAELRRGSGTIGLILTDVGFWKRVGAGEPGHELLALAPVGQVRGDDLGWLDGGG